MASESAVEARLLALYRRFLGEPEREVEVYAGFALFFGGIALGALGLVVFLWSATVPEETEFFFQLREVAITLAILGLPAFVLSVVVLLPVDRRAVYAAGAGAAVCVVATGVFVHAYPDNWNVAWRDYSTEGIALYAAGLSVLVASSGAALVAHHLERARAGTAVPDGPETPGGDAGAGGAAPDAGGEVTQEQVERDIEAAMEDAELTWGGVTRTETKRLTVDTGDDDIDAEGFDPDAATTVRSEGVDDAVVGLRALQGGDRKQDTSEGVDEQTEALRQLRERRRREEEERSTVDRLRDRLGL